MARTGVLVAGYGGPDSLEGIAPFMTNLMGRVPSDELIERVRRKYLAIGGSSPLTDIGSEIAVKLQEALVARGHDVPVEIGMRYWLPFIADGLERLKEAGCERVIVVSMSAFEARITTESYRKAVAEAAEPLGLTVVDAPLLSELPAFTNWFTSSTASSLFDLRPNAGAVIAFTAHSLPHADLVDDDPYVSGLERVADRVARELGLESGAEGAGEGLFESFRAFGSTDGERSWFMVYQSKGERPGAWLGPDLDELIDACAERGVPAIVVSPIGFLTDHMETLYDLDVVSAERALAAGVEFTRAAVPNDADMVVDALADVVAVLLD